jgi:hypothetical protein
VFGRIKTVHGCAAIKDLEVVMKCFITKVDHGHEEHASGLNYEAEVYSCVVANIESAFFVYPFAVFSKPPRLVDPVDLAVCRLLPWKRMQATMSIDDEVRIKCVVMENCGDTTLLDKVERCDGNTFVQLTLQMLAALKIMQKNRVTHNDMHWANVLVETSSVPFFLDILTRKTYESIGK